MDVFCLNCGFEFTIPEQFTLHQTLEEHNFDGTSVSVVTAGKWIESKIKCHVCNGVNTLHGDLVVSVAWEG